MIFFFVSLLWATTTRTKTTQRAWQGITAHLIWNFHPVTLWPSWVDNYFFATFVQKQKEGKQRWSSAKDTKKTRWRKEKQEWDRDNNNNIRLQKSLLFSLFSSCLTYNCVTDVVAQCAQASMYAITLRVIHQGRVEKTVVWTISIVTHY